MPCTKSAGTHLSPTNVENRRIVTRFDKLARSCARGFHWLVPCGIWVITSYTAQHRTFDSLNSYPRSDYIVITSHQYIV
ncbi:hypothetical protein SAMN03159382_05981 [Pseudomonas sp. NFACC23-1]|nr:hypothetical protein SAMN03159386_05976 [Pseudomonas sp. NFACC17-2]SEJ99624.1 hypothetical protein SAMN03159382_05981 [Pseudomonas sp. NFACC23-1]SFW92882.1 hypothetical protein SAMN05660640_05791 [Pseudomonas sp. NFACC16-2]